MGLRIATILGVALGSRRYSVCARLHLDEVIPIAYGHVAQTSELPITAPVATPRVGEPFPGPIPWITRLGL